MGEWCYEVPAGGLPPRLDQSLQISLIVLSTVAGAPFLVKEAQAAQGNLSFGGPPLPIPEVQCLGTQTFEYALVPHPGDWRAIYRDAYTFRAPVYLRRGDEHKGYTPTPADLETWGTAGLKPLDLSGELPGELSFLTLQPETLALSAVKRAEGDDRLIVRFYNPTDEKLEADLRTFLPVLNAWEVNLNEAVAGPLPILEGKGTRVAVAGKEVETIALVLQRPKAGQQPAALG